MSSKADLRSLVDNTLGLWGRIDTLVCNAASNPYFGPLSGIADDQFRKQEIVIDGGAIAANVVH
jgi:NAD(P)-dependent dehydrogenase (short-subunit alcohol dehydrogenase family)